MSTAWWVPYLGEPTDDAGHHCWYYFTVMQAEVFGLVDLPSFECISRTDTEAVSALFLRHPERKHWYHLRPLAAPRDGDAVYLQYSDEPLHIGIYAAEAEGVVHAPPGELGVQLTTLDQLRGLNPRHVRFYRHRQVPTT